MAAPQQSVGFGSVLPIASETTAASQPAGELSSVLGKARMILDAFDTDHSDLSLTELTRRSGVAKATVHRLAGELVEWGLLERAGTKYRLGLRLFELGQLVPRQRILRDAALPYMEDLLLATQETVHFAVRDGIDVLYIEKIIGHRGLNQQSRVAGRLPPPFPPIAHSRRFEQTRSQNETKQLPAFQVLLRVEFCPNQQVVSCLVALRHVLCREKSVHVGMHFVH